MNGKISIPTPGAIVEVLGRPFTVIPQTEERGCTECGTPCSFTSDIGNIIDGVGRCESVMCHNVIWLDPITYAKLRLTQ